MQQRGWDVTYLPVKSDGLVDLDQLRDAIRPDTAIVSVMYVNNEIGELHPFHIADRAGAIPDVQATALTRSNPNEKFSSGTCLHSGLAHLGQ